MATWNDVSTISRLVRSLVKDRLRGDGRDAYSFLGDASFTLTEDFPDSASIKVYKNGTLLTTGYSYNATSNIVTITAMLATNDTILICYNFYDKYSSNEIVDYIESSFAYFAQWGYRKLFKLSDDRTQVIAIDGVNPTAKECYEIAIITSILIDPCNIEIRTKDFTVTAMEKESRNELISRAMNQFTTWYGEFSWDETLNPDVP